MLFNSLPFVLYFMAIYFLYRALPASQRNGLLLTGSLVFYTLWIPSYVVLLLADIAINYALLQAMQRSSTPRRYMVLSVCFTLGLLGVFKYAALAVETLSPLLREGIGIELPVPELMLPLGVSFYSFQIIALNVDCYRRQIQAPKSLTRYALFISFFPQLIAGPILRGADFLPQLERGGEMTRVRTQRGIWLIVCGLVKKLVFADFLLAPFVENVFSTPGLGSVGFHLVAIWSFTFQIYFDFSGYCDMARGLALLLGFELPLNFQEPFLSRNPAEFWRRWHITLSNWLRDYIYVSLGSHRVTKPAFNRLAITMLLGGLWHGASWTFVIWGAIHGALLVLHRVVSPVLSRIAPKSIPGQRIWHLLCVVATFQMVCIAFVFFRSPNYESSVQFLVGIFGGHGLQVWPWVQLLIVLLCGGLHVGERFARERVPALQAICARTVTGGLVEGAALGVALGLAIAASGVGSEFIYFQF